LNKLPNAAILPHTELDECNATQPFTLDRTNHWYWEHGWSMRGQFTM